MARRKMKFAPEDEVAAIIEPPISLDSDLGLM